MYLKYFSNIKTNEIISKYSVFFIYSSYIIYILRFFTIISAVFGFLLMLMIKNQIKSPYLWHVERLLNLFYVDVIVTSSMFGLFGICYCIAPPSDPGLWELVYILPVGVFLAWNVVLLISLVNGVCSFSVQQSAQRSVMRTVRP